MMYEEELVKKAFLLYQEVMLKGELPKKENPELFSYYFEIDIRDILERVYLPCSESKILHIEDTLYFVPEIENDAYTYSNEELRKMMGLSFNRELYLAQFIWMNVLSEFYGDQFQQTNQTRSFVKVDEIIHKVEEYMNTFMKIPEEELIQLANDYQLDLIGMIDVWNSLEELTEKNKEVKRYKKKKYSFFLRVLDFWEKEKLLQVKEEQEISLTKKMENIVGAYYHNEERINKIKELLDSIVVKGLV
jgi:hypothetical protein